MARNGDLLKLLNEMKFHQSDSFGAIFHGNLAIVIKLQCYRAFLCSVARSESSKMDANLKRILQE